MKSLAIVMMVIVNSTIFAGLLSEKIKLLEEKSRKSAKTGIPKQSELVIGDVALAVLCGEGLKRDNALNPVIPDYCYKLGKKQNFSVLGILLAANESSVIDYSEKRRINVAIRKIKRYKFRSAGIKLID